MATPEKSQAKWKRKIAVSDRIVAFFFIFIFLWCFFCLLFSFFFFGCCGLEIVCLFVVIGFFLLDVVAAVCF